MKKFFQNNLKAGLLLGFIAFLLTFVKITLLVAVIAGVFGLIKSIRAIKQRQYLGFLGAVLSLTPFLYILFLLFVLGYVFTRPKPPPQPVSRYPSPATEFTTEPTTKPLAVKTYTSQKLGVTFQYYDESNPQVKEEGNKIYVWADPYDANQGGALWPDKYTEYVEVLRKTKDAGFKETIEKQILGGYSLEKCKVEIGGHGGKFDDANYIKALINDMTHKFADDPYYCPEAYARKDGYAEFLYDSKYPGEILFVYGGQGSGVRGPSKGFNSWFETIRILK